MDEKAYKKIIKDHNHAINKLKNLVEKYDNVTCIPVEEVYPLLPKIQYLHVVDNSIKAN